MELLFGFINNYYHRPIYTRTNLSLLPSVNDLFSLYNVSGSHLSETKGHLPFEIVSAGNINDFLGEVP